MSLLLLCAGFIMLVKSADLLVKGAVALARHWGISDLVIGLTIVAFGTSAPELFVSSVAAWQGNATIALSNVIGSNISNTLLVLGIAATIRPVRVPVSTLRWELPVNILAAVGLGLLLFVLPGQELSRTDGMLLLCGFVGFIRYCLSQMRNSPPAADIPAVRYAPPRAAIVLVLGLIGLPLGAQWLVDGAIRIASALGVSQEMIGLTIVAIGTSLPEIATTLTAAAQKNSAVAVGTVIGSNIFNIFLILGTAAVVRPLPAPEVLRGDMLILCGVSVVILLMARRRKESVITRAQGGMLVGLFGVYLLFLLLRG